MTQPSEQAVTAAAQLWCKPEHSHKVMDPDFAHSIAQEIDAQVAAEGRRWAALDDMRLVRIQELEKDNLRLRNERDIYARHIATGAPLEVITSEDVLGYRP